MKTVDIGRLGEDQAARFLKKNKFKIIERNLHVSHNEIDIIAISKKQRIIAFVEVKARTVDKDLYSPFGTPASAVTKEKQRRTIEAARGYLRSNEKYFDFQPRFDVLEIYLDREDMKVLKINHIENAFGV
ncbi:MAG: YraN family protein [Clostridia bacterium]|nr:YraN family protein [Clostridia bacterium]MBR2850658.1 YraN family protein [Clostridia bacterium]